MAAEEMDLELLISVTGGLGTWQQDADNRLVYCKTNDTLGKCFARSCLLLLGHARGTLQNQQTNRHFLHER